MRALPALPAAAEKSRMFTFLCFFEIVGKSQRLEVPVLALLAAGSEALVPCLVPTSTRGVGV